MTTQPPQAPPDQQESLAAALLTLLGRRPRSREEDDGEDGGPRGSDAQSRIRDLVRERNALKEQIAEAVKAAKEIDGRHAAEVKALKEGFAAEAVQIASRKDAELKLYEAGLSDADGRGLVLRAYDAAPKATRGETPAAYWQSLVAAHHAHLADPEKAPAPAVSKAMAAYFPPPPEPQKGAGGGKTGGALPGQRQAPPPRLDAGTARGAKTIADLPAAKSAEEWIAALQDMERG